MLNLAQLTTLKINCSQDPRKKKGWEEKKKDTNLHTPCSQDQCMNQAK